MLDKCLGVALLIVAAVLAVGLRIESLDLTEGQAFIEHWDGWLLVALQIGTGCYLLRDKNAKVRS